MNQRFFGHNRDFWPNRCRTTPYPAAWTGCRTLRVQRRAAL